MGNPKGVKRDCEQFLRLEQRRLKAAKLFDKGFSQAEVARQLGVHKQSVNRWYKAWQSKGVKGLQKAGRAGRKPRLQPAQLEDLRQGLKQGPEVLGYGSGLWTTWRVTDLIERQTGLKFHPGHVWRILRSLGWSCHAPLGAPHSAMNPPSNAGKR